MSYERLTKRGGFTADLDLTQEYGYQHIYNRLAELEDKLESGTLVELPCKRGDPVWVVYRDFDICGEHYKIYEAVCCGFDLSVANYIRIITNFSCYESDRFGNFTTKEAAKAKLKELQEEGK